jgi:hypothetical protein
VIVMSVAIALLATAAAAAIFGRGSTDATPHGRLLEALTEVAEAQEAYYHEKGRFAGWTDGLSLETGAKVELTQLRGDESRWEAVVRATDAGLSCAQSGRSSEGRPIREEATCYALGD